MLVKGTEGIMGCAESNLLASERPSARKSFSHWITAKLFDQEERIIAPRGSGVFLHKLYASLLGLTVQVR